MYYCREQLRFRNIIADIEVRNSSKIIIFELTFIERNLKLTNILLKLLALSLYHNKCSDFSSNIQEIEMENEIKIAWGDKYSIGYPIIDSQHKNLLKHIGDLLKIVANKGKKTEVGKTFRFLQKYVVSHFATEEGIMLKTGFSGYAEHKKKHEELLEKVNLFVKEYDLRGASDALLIRTTKELWEWYKNHLLKVDKELGDFLKDLDS